MEALPSREAQGADCKSPCIFRCQMKEVAEHMYRLLIVDDEPIIVEGLFDTFYNREDLPLEVYRAYDGQEAYELARHSRIDILLTDIEMPGMNGIELQQQVVLQWPRCKTVFLTGYNDFNYIQASIRGGANDYVLKTEGHQAVVSAVEKAVRQLEEQLQYDQLLGQASSKMSEALPILRKEYVLELLRGEVSTDESRAARFAALDIPLRADQPVYLVTGRIDAWREDIVSSDKALFEYSINNIIEEYFAHLFRTVHLTYAPDRMLWILQSHTDNERESMHLDRDNNAHYILETIESVQTACSRYLQLRCSFVVGSAPRDWCEISLQFDRLSALFTRGLGQGKEVVLLDRHLVSTEERVEQVKLKRVQLLGEYLENKQLKSFYSLLDEIMGTVGSHSLTQPGIGMEIYYSVATMFISYLNRWNLMQELSDIVSINQLISIDEHASWQDATRFFHNLAGELFERRNIENELEMNELVRKIHEFVDSHLEGDISLSRLADLVYLTPSYLSRFYKQETGGNLIDYITSVKLRRAKALLADMSLKVQEVGVSIGFESASYFNRFFKKHTHQTPQEYRDMLKRI
ncbi:response regulator [Paenibacillaceae bacterium]|nr:response regulator [Paenibacillaceae bacterium]